MEKNRTYTLISIATVKGARDRALANLNALTKNKADKAIACVQEYLELDHILVEYEGTKGK